MMAMIELMIVKLLHLVPRLREQPRGLGDAARRP
jgi:hypothetical protein